MVRRRRPPPPGILELRPPFFRAPRWPRRTAPRRSPAFPPPPHSASCFAGAQLPVSKVQASRVAGMQMGARKGVAKKAVVKKSTSTEGKGGIFPWITNTPGSTPPPFAARTFYF